MCNCRLKRFKTLWFKHIGGRETKKKKNRGQTFFRHTCRQILFSSVGILFQKTFSLTLLAFLVLLKVLLPGFPCLGFLWLKTSSSFFLGVILSSCLKDNQFTYSDVLYIQGGKRRFAVSIENSI